MSEVGRAEFDAWTRRVEQNASAVSASAALSVQMTEVIKDVQDLRQDLRNHRAEHDTETQRRTVARRWAIGLAVVLFSALEWPLLDLLIRR